MTRNLTPRSQSLAVLCIAGLAVSAAGGCAAVKVPGLALGAGPGDAVYEGVDGSFHRQSSIGEQTYHAVRRARSENGIVMQVVDDETPIRVLPLPPEGQSVYVSNLLEQTGVQRELGFVEATLFRHSTDAIGGIPMEVKMSDDGRSVKPESDYALQAGDRLRVAKATSPALQGLVNTILGL